MYLNNRAMLPYVSFGRGIFNQLQELLEPCRVNSVAPFIFLVDDALKAEAEVTSRIPLSYADKIHYVSSKAARLTHTVDTLVEDLILTSKEKPSVIIGVGGAAVLGLTKAVAVMLTNEGSIEAYRGMAQLKHNGVYHVGIPTISGTGVEASNSITLIGTDEKIEVHSNFLCFNQVLLDPELTRTVLKQDWFYTGVHCFIKAVEGKHSFNRNTLSTSYSDIAYRLCIDVFIQQELSKREAQDKLMVASWHSGIPTNYTQMGIAQALSYGLSHILELQHNKAICIVFKYLEEFYAEDVLFFNKMLELHDIIVPEGLCLNVLEKDINRMVDMALSLEYLWENTLGRHWKKSITPKKIKDLYLSM